MVFKQINNFCITSVQVKRMPAQEKQRWSISRDTQQDSQNHCALEAGAHLNLLSYFPRRFASPPPATVLLLSGRWDRSRQEHKTGRFFTIHHRFDMWKSHTPHNSECTPWGIRDKHLFLSPNYKSSSFYSKNKNSILTAWPFITHFFLTTVLSLDFSKSLNSIRRHKN